VPIAYTVNELLRLIGEGSLEGQPAQSIAGIASLKQAQPGDLAFLGNLKYKAEVPSCRATVLLLPLDFEGHPGPGQAYIRLAKPSLALARVCREIERLLWPRLLPGIHPSALVQPGALVDPSAHVGPFCIIESGAQVGPGSALQAQVYLGRDVQIGADCWLMPRVAVMEYCTVGRRVRLHSGVVVGSDGFGYDTHNGRHEKIPQIGRVILEDDVEIGANSTIDRARFSETRIGEGTKIDNLVQIGHNVIIGKHCLIVAQAGVSGSTTLEDYVIIGGQAGLTGHLHIGTGSMIGAQSGVIHDLPPKSMERDSPSMPYMIAQKVHVLKGRLPELFKRVARLEETVAHLRPGAKPPGTKS